MIVSLLPVTALATGTSYAITNGSPEDGKETNHGYISIDKATAAESDTVTVEAHPEEGYQLKSLTATPVAPTISTIADVLATVEGFPEDTSGGTSPVAPSSPWINEKGVVAFKCSSALILMKDGYTYGQLSTKVKKEENCYTATISYGSLTFNMENGILTSFEFTADPSKPNAVDYVGTYTPADTPSARLKPITPAKQQNGTYQFTMPGYAVTVTAEFEIPSDPGTEGNPWNVGTTGHESDETAYVKDGELFIDGKGEIGGFSGIEGFNAGEISVITVKSGTVTGAEANAFAGFNGCSLTLPDGWQGDLPDDLGKWYGGYVELSAFPTAVKNVTFQQRWPWNEMVDIAFTVTGDPGDVNVTVTVKDGSTVLKSILLTVTIPEYESVGTGSYVWDASKAILAEDFSENVTVEVAVVGPAAGQLWAGGPIWADSNLGTSEDQDHPKYGALYTFAEAGTSVGAGWRLPTKDEFEKLINDCTGAWDVEKKGYTFTGIGDYASQSIFLPAAGYKTGTMTIGVENQGYYWSSTEDVPNAYAYHLFINGSTAAVVSSNSGSQFSVRPVKDATPDDITTVASATSAKGTIDLRTAITLPEKSVKVEGVTWSDTAWGAAPSFTSTDIGWKKTDVTPNTTGKISEGLTGNEVAPVILPAKDGTYQLTHSTGDLTSFVTFKVTGYPLYSVTFDESFEPVNGGKTITFSDSGTSYDVTAPTVSEGGNALDPQPEMTVTYYESDGQGGWTALNATPTDAGSYKVVFAVKEDNATYTGSKGYPFSIVKANVATPTDGVGYTVVYVNETITSADGYEISTATDFSTKLSGETAIDFTKSYYVRKAEDNNHNASEGTPFSFTRPKAPVLADFTMTGETVENKKDGTFSGITAEMEYKKGDGDWTSGPATLTGLSNETIKVRCKATTEAFKSEEYSYTFTASTEKLTVNINGAETQIAYGEKLSRPDPDPEQTDYTFGGWYSDEECTQAWNFAIDTVKDDMNLYPKWIKNTVPSTTISGNVTQGDTAVSDATVELYLGTEKVAATVTGGDGSYVFDKVEKGTYNIVVTKGDGKTKTELVTVDSTGSFSANVELPTKAVSSKVEHKGTAVADAKSDIKETVVGGLDAIASNTNVSAGKVTIKLTVEPKADTGTAAQQEIKSKAGSGKKVEFLDLSLIKETWGEEDENIGADNEQLLTIVIPFDFTGVDVSSVMIIRKHGGNTEKLTGTANANGEYFKADEQAGTLTLYAMKFSDYAVAYAEQSSHGGHSGGSYTPGHTVTSDLKNVTKVTIDGKAVDSRYYTVSGGNIALSGEFMKTLTNGKHTVKLYDGLKVATGTITVTGNTNVISAPTGDMGVALYAALSVSSMLGMGWVGRKKHGEE